MVGFSSAMSSSNNLTSCNHCTNRVYILSKAKFDFSQHKVKSKAQQSYQAFIQWWNIWHVLTPRQKPIEAPCIIIASSMTLSKICARGRYDRYTSLSLNCKQENGLQLVRTKKGYIKILIILLNEDIFRELKLKGQH